MNRKNFLTTLGVGAIGINRTTAAAAPAVPPGQSLPVMADLSSLLSLDEVEQQARAVMSPAVTAFLAGGAADEFTTRWNHEKYQTLRLLQKVLIDVSHVDCTTTLFGQRLNLPVLLAPTSSHRYVHPEGEMATARGAGMAGATMVVSSGATTSVEDIMSVATQPLWFQLYVAKDRGLAKALIQRVEAAGVKAICVTVDTPVDGPRNRQFHTPMATPPGVTFPHYVGITEPASVVTLDEVKPALLVWRDIEWIRSLTKLPMLLKGVMNPADAEQGLKLGADGIIVSNHGGRCLDTQPATIEALPRVVAQVRGRVPVLVDGGIRRGTDVVKALALGAAAVQIGRPYVYGLAVGGAEGVAHVVKVLRQELLLAMALLGRPTIASIDRSTLWD